MCKTLSKIRIPLSDIAEEEKKMEKETHGTIIVITSEEPCLTCGRHRMMRFNQRIDGKLYRIVECLFCTVRVKTAANMSVK